MSSIFTDQQFEKMLAAIQQLVDQYFATCQNGKLSQYVKNVTGILNECRDCNKFVLQKVDCLKKLIMFLRQSRTTSQISKDDFNGLLKSICEVILFCTIVTASPLTRCRNPIVCMMLSLVSNGWK